MTEQIRLLISRLAGGERLSRSEFQTLIEERDEESTALLRRHAVETRHRYFGRDVYIRGLVEVSSICKNDCYYCGIRASNRHAVRYRLDEDQILSCCDLGYELGLRTFVLQGGEDGYFTDERLCRLIERLKESHPDCAITLSLGERSRESYALLKAAGADRYLLRHETADETHYAALHPAPLTLENRMRCLHDLRQLGYQVGCGFMVGSPGQTPWHLSKDLEFIASFRPEMCGIGPFLPHHATPFASHSAGSADLTCYLLSILRLIHPPMLLPSTTALSTLCEDGREQGILSGANVVMPNLSPADVRAHYELYDGKKHSGAEAVCGLDELSRRMEAIGYRTVTARGDFNPHPQNEASIRQKG